MNNTKKVIYIFSVVILMSLFLIGLGVVSYKASKINNIQYQVNSQEKSDSRYQSADQELKKENLYKVHLSLDSGVSHPKPYKEDIDYGSSSLNMYLNDLLFGIHIILVSYILPTIQR